MSLVRCIISSSFLLILLSCSKGSSDPIPDDPDEVKQSAGTLSIGGKSYIFKGAGYQDWGYDSDSDKYNIGLALASEEIKYYEVVLDRHSHTIIVDCYSKGSTFKNDTFRIKGDDYPRASVIVKIDDKSFSLTGGTVNVDRKGINQFTISFDGVSDEGVQVKGTYSGQFIKGMGSN